MGIENIIAKGIGFSPGSTKYLPTHGFDIGEPPPDVLPGVKRPADTWDQVRSTGDTDVSVGRAFDTYQPVKRPS